MKSVITVLAVSFLSLSAIANMQVGDTAVYTVNNNGTAFEITHKVLEVSGTDVLVEETFSYQGQKQVDTFWEDEDDLVSSEEGQFFVDNCSQLGGVNEKLKAAGKSLNTCRMNDEDNPADFVNVGAVPFGIIKGRADDPQDGLTTIELIQFTNAN